MLIKTNMTLERVVLKQVVQGYYDFQGTRMSFMNRLRNMVRKLNEGIPFDQKEVKLSEAERSRFQKKYSDKRLPIILEALERAGKISQEEMQIINNLIQLLKDAAKTENRMAARIEESVEPEQIWQEFLQYIKGVGEVLAGNLIHRFGYCEKSPHISSLWKYCGLHVVNGKAPRREAGIKMDGRVDCKTLMRKIADSLIKQNSPIYREVYDKEKRKHNIIGPKQICLSEREEIIGELVDSGTLDGGKEKWIIATEVVYNSLLGKYGKKAEVSVKMGKGHIHARCLRKVAKLFLSHYWVACREIKGLPTEDPWIIEHGGHKDLITWKDVVKANKLEKELV
ncbi:MAG: hypothetical protein KKA64_04130 [Nanoarchaeota archaeon]|nr:hypothetical protein [Nanoarchaeota archaeon]